MLEKKTQKRRVMKGRSKEKRGIVLDSIESLTSIERVRRFFEGKVDFESTAWGVGLHIVRSTVSGTMHSRAVEVG